MADGPVSLYSTRAHVFQINPETKASWIPKGQSAIPISFVATGPADRRELTIIGTNENGETVLNCVILPKTVFNKRSQKFGQWHDHNGMIYGLGFNSEPELYEFMDTFQQLQQNHSPGPADSSTGPTQVATISQQSQLHQNLLMNQTMDRTESASAWSTKMHQQQPQLQSNNSSSEMNGRDQSANVAPAKGASIQHQTLRHANEQDTNCNIINNNNNSSSNNNNNNNNDGLDNGTRYTRSQSLFGLQAQNPSSSIGGRATPNSEISNQNELQARDQIRYENERLKQALEESSKNAGVWQSELINLRTNNAKLTQALQESKAHVKEWEEELLGLRDENKELKLRIMVLESNSDADRPEDHKLVMQEYKDYIDQLQGELKKKDSELDQVQRSMEQLEIKASSTENGRLGDSAPSEDTIRAHKQKVLDAIATKLGTKIGQLSELEQELMHFSDKLYN